MKESEDSMSEELVSFFKALADASRLKIIGLLAARAHSVEELAAALGLKPSTVSHHLARLAEAGLVSVRTESYYSLYSLNREALEARSRSLFSTAELQAAAQDADLDAYDRKVVSDFSRRDGSLKTIPAQRRKLEAVLRYVVRSFRAGRRYSERQVNTILGRYHPDTATLRRELVGYGLMKREGGGRDYWRT
jgi:biotin operon repressor